MRSPMLNRKIIPWHTQMTKQKLWRSRIGFG